MKTIYRGFELNVERDQCLGGWDMIYYQAYTPDGVEVIASFTEEETTVREFMKTLKGMVDDVISNPKDYDCEL